MSIVEKAAEKLKASPSGSKPASRSGPVAAETPATIERAQERLPKSPPPTSAACLHVSRENMRRAGLYPGEQQARRRFTDELRHIKRPLLNHASARAAHGTSRAGRIVVTSAVPGEGKTFTALNLAMSLAREPDFEVLLVDGDIPKADVTRVLGLKGRPGLMDVLVHKECQPADVIVATDIPHLLVVPAGERHPLTAELFGGKRMEHVLEAWSRPNRQRLLVFDSSPLLATPESAVLLSHMGQVFMVVAAGRTRQQELKIAMQNLDDSQHVGLILNKSRLPASESHDYGYYGDYESMSADEEA